MSDEPLELRVGDLLHAWGVTDDPYGKAVRLLGFIETPPKTPMISTEHDAPPRHTVRLVIDEGVYPHLDCPFAAADETRPCWPHTEFGEPYPTDKGTSDGCVYQDWIEEEGIEAFKGAIELTFDLAAAEWDGDHFNFRLGAQPS